MFIVKHLPRKHKKTEVSEPGRFTLDIIWLTVAQLFVSVIFGIFTLPALTKSYTSDIYGTWIQASATVVLLSPLLSLQLGLAAIKFLSAEEDKVKRRRYLGSMLLAIILFAVILAIVSSIFSKQISILLFADSAYIGYVRLITLWTIFNALYNFFISYLRARNRIKSVSISYIFITIAQMMVILGLSRAAADLELIIVCIIAVQVIFAFVLFFWIVIDTGFPVPCLDGLRQFLQFSTPQMPGVVLLWLIGLSDRYFITHLLGLSKDGIYSSSNTIAGLITLFYAPISYALFPLISRFWAQNRFDDVKKYFVYSIKLYMTFAIPAAVGIYLLSHQLLNILTTSEFVTEKELVLFLALGAVFLGVYQISINLVLLGKYAKIMPFITASASIVNITINFFLIPRIGIIGAAISNCAAYFILSILTIIWARKTLGFVFDFKYLGKIIIGTFIMWLCISYLRIDGILGISALFLSGFLIFFISLMLLKAFSVQDIQFVKNFLIKLIPDYLKIKK